MRFYNAPLVLVISLNYLVNLNVSVNGLAFLSSIRDISCV